MAKKDAFITDSYNGYMNATTPAMETPPNLTGVVAKQMPP
jgi:hypothetical protein